MPTESNCPAWEKGCTPAPNPGPGYGGTTSGAPWNGSSPPPWLDPRDPASGVEWFDTAAGVDRRDTASGVERLDPASGVEWFDTAAGVDAAPAQRLSDADAYLPGPSMCRRTQPPPPPYCPPRPPILHPTDQYWRPHQPAGWLRLPGQGAPPPPPPSGYGWNNDAPPGAPPPNWEGPPPSGGWNGPPPAGGWNQPWQGPPVDQSYGHNYYAPFTYNNFTVLPVFNADYGGFGYWFFGVWVPLYRARAVDRGHPQRVPPLQHICARMTATQSCPQANSTIALGFSSIPIGRHA